MLTTAQHDALKREAATSGVSMGELVRRAVDHAYRVHRPRKVRGYELSVGVWRDPDAAVKGRRLKPTEL